MQKIFFSLFLTIQLCLAQHQCDNAKIFKPDDFPRKRKLLLTKTKFDENDYEGLDEDQNHKSIWETRHNSGKTSKLLNPIY